MMKNLWLFFIVTIIILSCTKEEKFEFPLVQTGEVVQIDDAGVEFHGKILNELSGKEIDHGFVWNTDSLPSLESGYSKRLGAVKDVLFSAHIGSYFITGQKYFVRAYVATSDYLVYGRSVSFISKGGGNMVASDFYPKTGSWGDTVSIVHKNISYKKGETKVFFGESNADVISADDSIIKAIVPPNIKQSASQISISVADKKWVLQNQFTLLPMVIDDFTPKLVTFGDIITIRGRNFNPVIDYNEIYLNGEKTGIVSCTQDAIQVIVSDNIKNSEQLPSVKIMVGDLQCSTNELLRLKSPVIHSFSPDQVDRKDQLVITGQHFNPTPNRNRVFLGGVEAEILSSTPTELVTNIPDGVVHGSNILSVEVANTTVEAENKIFIYEPWKRMNDFPGGSRYGAFTYTMNSFAYAGGGTVGWAENGHDLWEYNQSIDSWNKKNIQVDGYMLGFSYKNNSYHLEYNQLFKYDPANDSRELISVCESLYNASFIMAFVKDDDAYFIQNDYGNAVLWDYSFFNNSWTSKGLSFSSHGTFGFVNGDDAFYVSHAIDGPLINKLYKFNFTTKDFVEIMDLKDNPYLGSVLEASVFSVDNYSYIVDGHNMLTTSYYNKLVRYDKITNTFVELIKPPFDARTNCSAFSLGRKGYCGLGGTNNAIVSDIWEFDPDKMKPE